MRWSIFSCAGIDVVIPFDREDMPKVAGLHSELPLSNSTGDHCAEAAVILKLLLVPVFSICCPTDHIVQWVEHHNLQFCLSEA